MNKQYQHPFVFFGTSSFSIGVLEALKAEGVMPVLVVTAPDKPKGRGLAITPPPVKVWAAENKVPVLQPETLDDAFARQLSGAGGKLSVVASYGKIIPKAILDIPRYGTLNVHPSLLPRLRGASPIQSMILFHEKPGVTIILLDEKMDHGPIVAQREVPFAPWPPRASALEAALARAGGLLLAEVIPQWISGTIRAQEQEHAKATYARKLTKKDGLIDLAGDSAANLRKIRAFDVWPRAYFFAERHGKKIRVTVTDAELSGNILAIRRVVSEGKKEMNYEDFLRGA